MLLIFEGKINNFIDSRVYKHALNIISFPLSQPTRQQNKENFQFVFICIHKCVFSFKYLGFMHCTKKAARERIYFPKIACLKLYFKINSLELTLSLICFYFLISESKDFFFLFCYCFVSALH